VEQRPGILDSHSLVLTPEDAERYHEFVRARVVEELVHAGSVARQLLANTLSRAAHAAGYLRACQGGESCDRVFHSARLIGSANDWIGHPDHPDASRTACR
jgi:hypothetical protein